MSNATGLIQCPGCPRKLGKIARFCNSCGAKMPVRLDADSIIEMAKRREEDQEFFGGTCNSCHHDFLRAIIALERKERGGTSPYGYCPDCGIKLL